MWLLKESNLVKSKNVTLVFDPTIKKQSLSFIFVMNRTLIIAV